MRIGQGSEQLRQRSVADIIEAHQRQRQLELAEPGAQLQAERAAQIRRLAGIEVPTAQAELRGKLAAATHTELQNQELQTLAPLRRDQLQAQIAHLQATNVLQSAQATRLNALLGSDIELAKTELAKAQYESKIHTVNDPITGEPTQVLGKNLESFMTRRSSLAVSIADKRIDNMRQAEQLRLQAGRDERTRRTALANVEIQLNKSREGNAGLKTAASPYVDLYNELSDEPFVWLNFPDTMRTDKYDNDNLKERIPPTASGVQPVARDIHEAARQYPGGPITVKEYLEKYYYPRRVGRPAPWVR